MCYEFIKCAPEDIHKGSIDIRKVTLWDFGSFQYVIDSVSAESVLVDGEGSTVVGGPWKLCSNEDDAVLVGEGPEEDRPSGSPSILTGMSTSANYVHVCGSKRAM